MEAKASIKYARVSPRKAGLVCSLIRGKNVNVAEGLLKIRPNGVSEILQKLLKSAVANAENNFGMDTSKLYVSEVYANPGPILKRIQPVSRGRAHRINKRTSHITVVVKEREEA